MLNVDEDALLCDLAETYRIYDIKELPLSKVALFSYGLREESRIKKKMNDISVDTNQALLCAIYDKLSLIFWKLSGGTPPESIFRLFGKEKESDYQTFNNLDEFNKKRKQILNERGK